MTQRDKRILRQNTATPRGKEQYQKIKNKKERDSDTDVNAAMYKETERKD